MNAIDSNYIAVEISGSVDVTIGAGKIQINT
ncbi:uncharacterized protein METZ01_LOCUS87643 [marine metagenome]|jgi:hypothetical protein|uniref:Uncharacterized protein n=1 Tax=marine metagenome TaxID=408172 RepID=A0A381V320_9ZZZZ